MEWSPAHPITLDRNPAEHLEKKAGVYRVCAMLGNGRAVAIHRACAVDQGGVIYIGAANKSLEKRIGDLSHIPRGNPPRKRHELIDNWVDFDLDRLADRKQLVVQWEVCPNPETEERKLLSQYKTAFGDIPPGNLKLARP